MARLRLQCATVDMKFPYIRRVNCAHTLQVDSAFCHAPEKVTTGAQPHERYQNVSLQQDFLKKNLPNCPLIPATGGVESHFIYNALCYRTQANSINF